MFIITLLIVVRDVTKYAIQSTCSLLYSTTMSCVGMVKTCAKTIGKTIKYSELYELRRMILVNKLRNYVLEVKMSAVKGNAGKFSSLGPQKLSFDELRVLAEDIRFIKVKRSNEWNDWGPKVEIKILDLLDMKDYQGSTHVKLKVLVDNTNIHEVALTHESLIEVLVQCYLTSVHLPECFIYFGNLPIFNPAIKRDHVILNDDGRPV